MTGMDPTGTFRAEAQELLGQLEEALLELERRRDDPALVNTAFRALHTLKGSRAMFAPPPLAEFAHHVETAFEPVRGGASASAELIGAMLRSTDHLKALLDDVAAVDPAVTAALVEELG